MKEILSFIHKEFLHIFRDARTMLIILVMPVVQILLFGFAISTEVRNATVDIVGDPCDAAIRDIVPKLENNNNLSFGRFLDSPAQAEARLKRASPRRSSCSIPATTGTGAPAPVRRSASFATAPIRIPRKWSATTSNPS